MKKLIHAIIIVSLTIVFLEGTKTYSQCKIKATAIPDTVCAGDAVSLSSKGGCGYNMESDFNLGVMGANWSSSAANPVFTNPCEAGPVGLHCWVGTTASPIRTLETASINASVGNCLIEWDMRYGRAQSSGSCEAPSYVSEGVHLQYSINNGSTWTDFPGSNMNPIGANSTTAPFITTTPGFGGYWAPVSGATAQSSCPLYFWHRYSSMIPPVASITNSKLRFAQLSYSVAGWNTWGIDEVEIVCPTGAVNILWTPMGAPTDTIDTVYNPGTIYLPQHPNNIPYDTCFVVKICDTIYSASDTVCVHVNPTSSSKFIILKDFSFLIIPTESENIFTIETLGISGKTNIRIINCTGQLIKSFALNINSYKFEKSINLSGLNSGIYYINLSNKKVRTTRKIFVQ